MLRASPVNDCDATEDAPLSDHGNGDGDQEMGDVVEHPDDDDQAGGMAVPQESQEEDADAAPADMRDEDSPHNPWEPRRPMEPGEILLQGF